MNQLAPCPKCRQFAAKQLNFTWWGGVIGPKILHHVKCQACGATYNGKTGIDNTRNIIIYYAVAIPIFIILLLVIIPLVILAATYAVNHLR